MKTILIFLIVTINTFISIEANVRCSSESPTRVPKYYLMEKCHRSKLGIAARANYTSLVSCHRLGIEKKGLALNFSPPEAAIMSGQNVEYTCEILKCAESDGGLSLANDTRYDYFSIYAKPLPNANSTCVPATGMFQLIKKKLNYTQAREACLNISAVLADVTGERRTDALAQLLAGVSVNEALVGLRRDHGSSFFGVNGDNLDCTTYRAWAPGHPRRYWDKFDCVVITRQRMWRSVSCKNKFPTLCELIPGGPYKQCSIFASKKQNDTDFHPT